MLLLGLLLTRELFGAVLPQLIEDEIKDDPEVKSLVEEVVRHVFFSMKNGVGKTHLNPDELYPVFVRMREHWWDKVRLKYRYYRGFIHIAFTPNRLDRELLHLPAGFNFLYYVLRPLRLIKEFRSHLKQAPKKGDRKSSP
jgi:hypothetical protein